MHISSFLNNPDAGDFHSNHYAGGTESEENFHERRAIDQKRQLVGRYKYSKLGEARASRTDFSPLRRTEQQNSKNLPQQTPIADQRASRNVSVPKRVFQEPTRRNYDPYV